MIPAHLSILPDTSFQTLQPPICKDKFIFAYYEICRIGVLFWDGYNIKSSHWKLKQISTPYPRQIAELCTNILYGLYWMQVTFNDESGIALFLVTTADGRVVVGVTCTILGKPYWQICFPEANGGGDSIIENAGPFSMAISRPGVKLFTVLTDPPTLNGVCCCWR